MADKLCVLPLMRSLLALLAINAVIDCDVLAAGKEEVRELISTRVLSSGEGMVPADHYESSRIVESGQGKSRVKRSLFSLDKERALLDRHNVLRRQEGSSDMELMVWNDFLASMASDWANACVYGHGQPFRNPASLPFDPLGQNIYATTGPELDDLNGLQLWYDEKDFYDYNSGFCRQEPCGHYTQVAWATTREVGCGFAFCPNLVNAFNNGHYLVCNYGPAGNGGGFPFKKGEACTQCSSGRGWCVDRLCNANCNSPSCGECRARCLNGGVMQADCTCSCQPGWHGADCSEVCENTDAQCGANPGWPAFWCDRDFVIRACPLLCDLCLAPGTPVTPATPGPPVPPTPEPPVPTPEPPVPTPAIPEPPVPTPQPPGPTPPASIGVRMDIIFVVDSSSSVGDVNWERMVDFAKNIIAQFSIGSNDVQFGFVSVGDRGYIEMYLNEIRDRDQIYRRLDFLSWRNEGRNLADGLYDASDRMLLIPDGGARSFARNLVILLTSGRANVQASELRSAARSVTDIGDLVVIGVTQSANLQEFRDISSGGDFVRFVDSFSQLSTLEVYAGNVVRELAGMGSQTTQPTPATPRPTGRNVDVVLIMDSSSSVGSNNWVVIKNFAKDVISNFNLQDVRFAFITFSSHATVDIFLDDSQDESSLFREIDRLPWKGSASNLADGLRMARTHVLVESRGDRYFADNLVILLTDGPASAEMQQTVFEANMLKNTPHTTLMMIGVTSRVDRAQMNEMASSPTSRYVRTVSGFGSLAGLTNTVFDEIREIGFQSNSGPQRTRPTPMVFTPPPRFNPAGRGRADVVFVMDSSGSVGYFNWIRIKDFVNRIILSFDMGTNDLQFAFVTVGSKGYADVFLNVYTNHDQLYYKILNLPWKDESTNLADGLRMARNEILSTRNGERRDSRNLVVLLTDGPATAEQNSFVTEGFNIRNLADTRVMVIGVTSKVDASVRDDITRFASSPTSRYARFIQSFDDLDGLRNDVIDVIVDNLN